MLRAFNLPATLLATTGHILQEMGRKVKCTISPSQVQLYPAAAVPCSCDAPTALLEIFLFREIGHEKRAFAQNWGDTLLTFPWYNSCQPSVGRFSAENLGMGKVFMTQAGNPISRLNGRANILTTTCAAELGEILSFVWSGRCRMLPIWPKSSETCPITSCLRAAGLIFAAIPFAFPQSAMAAD